MPSEEAQLAFHRSEAYFAHPYFRDRRGARGVHEARCERVFRKIAAPHLPSAPSGLRLLDVGCDTGGFLLAAIQREGVHGEGVEISQQAAAGARRAGLQVHPGPLATAPEAFSGYDVVTAFDLLEHVPNPAALLAEVRKRMRPGGLLFLQTPNLDSSVFSLGRLGIRLLGPSTPLDRLFPEEHCFCVTPEGLRTMAERAGFETLTLEPRGLDGAEQGLGRVARGGIAALGLLDSLLSRGILLGALLRRRE